MAVTVTSITPAIGSTAGGTAVEIAGTGFQGTDLGASTTVKVNGVDCTAVTVVDDTLITCNTPANAAGVYDVAVYTDAGNGTLVGGYTYVAPPVVTGVSPAAGPESGGTAVEITGTGFLASPVVSFAGVVASSIVRVDSTKITCVTPAGPVGAVNVYVQNGAAGGSLSHTLVGGYTYVAAPTVTRATPSSGIEGTAVMITGADFVDGATLTIGGVAASGVAFVSSSSLTAIVPRGVLGAADVVVTNPDTRIGTLAGGFTYVAPSETQTLIRLLPPGRLWNLEPGSALRRVLLAISDELARVRQRGVDLINESDPRTASETLADWEEMLALPDELVTAIPGTTAGRRVAIAAKYAARGGQNDAFFSTLCSACGYPLVSITTYAADLTRSGTLRSGDTLVADAWAYTMTITVSPATTGALTHAQFEAVVRRATHSHITVLFVYT